VLSLGTFEEACVFAIPDKEVGNRIGAAVVLRQCGSQRPAAGDVANALLGRIAPFKFSNEVFVLNDMPKTQTERRSDQRL
jgi:acyl-coenzyme A synthetase/AMP-(fatty) acid ligase